MASEFYPNLLLFLLFSGATAFRLGWSRWVRGEDPPEPCSPALLLFCAALIFSFAGFTFALLLEGKPPLRTWGMGGMVLGVAWSPPPMPLLAERWGWRIWTVGVLQCVLCTAIADFLANRHSVALPPWLLTSAIVLVASQVVSATLMARAGVQKLSMDRPARQPSDLVY